MTTNETRGYGILFKLFDFIVLWIALGLFCFMIYDALSKIVGIMLFIFLIIFTILINIIFGDWKTE